EAGTVKLVGTDYAAIVKNVSILINDSLIYNQMYQSHNPYGDGKACEKIVLKIE
ncbi:MAG: UDP-N-acetylglucosamine 2-epimerase, partial [Dysgonamonadaceae bacterium]|nr:UDP-N-acetylglucosamine 2-epimerase [Dysgonamonadaceae bacterium]